MSLFDLAAAARRFWWAALGGLLLTAAAMHGVMHVDGVYWARVDVVFLRPSEPSSPNTLSRSATRVIEAASVIQREVNGIDGTHVVSDSVTIVDEGIREGVRVQLPNAGGQLANNFNRPFLTVDVVDPTEEGAQRLLDATLAKINESLAQRQEAAGVSLASRLTTELSPPRPAISYATGLPKRAAAVTALVGLGLTFAALVGLERRGSFRREPRSAERVRPSGLVPVSPASADLRGD